MELFYFLARSSRKTVALAVLFGIVSGFASASLIRMINLALNRDGLSPGRLIWSFIGLCVIVLIMETVCQIISSYLVQTAILNLRLKLSNQILAAPLRRLEEVGAARLLACLTDDINVISLSLLSLSHLCINTATVTVCLIYLGYLSWTGLVALLALLLLGIFIYKLLELRALRALRTARDEWDSLMRHFEALTHGIKELKLHRRRREDFFSQVLNPTAALVRSHSISGMVTYTVAGSWSNLLFFVVVGLLLFIFPLLEGINRQSLIGYTLTILFMTGPLRGLIAMLPQLGQARVSMNKVDSLGFSLGEDPIADNSTLQTLSPPTWRRLELTGVTHSYLHDKDECHFVLGPINVAFTPGEIVFLIGGNGSGKSTLAKLLVGLYIPEAGEIRLNGQPVCDENRDHYRQLFSMVFSDFYLFESLLGLLGPSLDWQAKEYLTQLQLDSKVDVKDGRLSTLALSQGQRKRLALLTAYLEDRPFYVFDEWASDQDPLFKEVFYTKLLPDLKRRGKTILTITHDDKYFYLADRLIKLDYGKVTYHCQHVEPGRMPDEMLYSGFQMNEKT
jgi:putative pyoverdin transport system ATP-binding/permease protein